AENSTSYSKLSLEQKIIWQRILLQEDAYLRPSNADYYLSNTATPDLAVEFDLAEQYLRGTLPFTDAVPWCKFPARFAFVSKVIYGSYFMPEAFRSCNIPLPVVDDSLKADIVQTFESIDSGEALFHVDLLVQGRRFYNGSALTLNMGYFRKNESTNNLIGASVNTSDAFKLLNAFWGRGKMVIRLDDSPNGVRANQYGQQSYRINLPPEKIYFMVLMAFELRRARLPYNLLRANCHSDLELIFLAVLPHMPNNKRMFFDYMPTFMDGANAQNDQLFEPSRYWAPPKQQLDSMSKQLNWEEYQILQNFISHGTLPKGDNLAWSQHLRLAIGKAAEQRVNKLKKSPKVLALRDEYLSSSLHRLSIEHAVNPPEEDENTVPIFNSPHPSAIGLQVLNIAGEAKLQLELNVFNTMADRLQAAAPYGFAMGKAYIQASKQGLAFDHFMLAEENSVGNACCGATLYQLGVRRMSGISLDIVNRPQTIDLQAWKLNPHLELNFTEGIGTISNNGWSAQLLPSVSVLTYGEHVDLSVNAKIGWQNNKLAVSASKLGRVYGPDDRRSKPDETFNLEYKLSKDARIQLSYKHYDALGTIAGVGYVQAF
ncbi:MAG: hypothetical protein HOP21_08360, partial [Methylotenera sp.]|nr:hypothetical protein [Methylotenera sp.]